MKAAPYRKWRSTSACRPRFPLFTSLCLQVLACCSPSGELSGSIGGGSTGVSPSRDTDEQPAENASPAGSTGAGTLTPPSSKFPALELDEVSGSSQDLLGFAGLDGSIVTSLAVSVMPRARTFECIDTPRAEDDTYMAQLYSCNGSLPQKFIFTEDGHIKLGYRFRENSPTLCLVGGDVSPSAVTVAPCSADVGQLWRGGGHLLQHQKTKLCLSRHDGSQASTRLALTKCRRDEVNQSWVVGDSDAMSAIAQTVNPAFPHQEATFGTRSSTALVGYPAVSSLPIVGQPTLLALRQGVDVCVGIDVRQTPPLARLYRCEQAPRVVFQPDGRLESFGTAFASQPTCFVAGPGVTNSAGNLITAKCSTAAEQKWVAVGHNLQHAASGLCLSYDETRYADGTLSLKSCDANELRQSWGAGELAAMREEARQTQKKVSLEALCSLQATVLSPTTPNKETTWLINHFGGTLTAMRQEIQKALTQDCRVIYYASDQVMPLPPIIIRFEVLSEDSGTAAWAGWSTYPYFALKVNPQAWSNRAQNDLLPDSVMRHEIAHLFDRRNSANGVNTNFGGSLLIEGYADWVAKRAGYYTEAQRRGGYWNTGYVDSMYFLMWLDTQFPPTAPGQRFTERAKAQMHSPQTDPNWFDSWSRTETGSTMDQLWLRYQKSF